MSLLFSLIISATQNILLPFGDLILEIHCKISTEFCRDHCVSHARRVQAAQGEYKSREVRTSHTRRVQVMRDNHRHARCALKPRMARARQHLGKVFTEITAKPFLSLKGQNPVAFTILCDDYTFLNPDRFMRSIAVYSHVTRLGVFWRAPY